MWEHRVCVQSPRGRLGRRGVRNPQILHVSVGKPRGTVCLIATTLHEHVAAWSESRVELGVWGTTARRCPVELLHAAERSRVGLVLTVTYLLSLQTLHTVRVVPPRLRASPRLAGFLERCFEGKWSSCAVPGLKASPPSPRGAAAAACPGTALPFLGSNSGPLS